MSVYTTLFEIFLVVKSIVSVLFSTGVTITYRLVDAAHPRKYVFFNGYTTPYLAHKVRTVAPGVPAITWTYNLDRNVLTRDEEAPLQNLQWLSGSISYNGMNLYSLDDFISSIKFAGDRHPPPAVVVGAWSLYTGIVLDNQLNLELSVVNDDGNMLSFSPWSFTTKPAPVTTLVYENLYIESGLTERVVSKMPPLVDYEMPPIETT